MLQLKWSTTKTSLASGLHSRYRKCSKWRDLRKRMLVSAKSMRWVPCHISLLLSWPLIQTAQAFATQAVMSIKHVGLPFEIVNPVGGAIAFGHPLGCTGARQLATAFGEAKRENKKVFVTSVCIGTGMVSVN